ncbi:uncharacterized protein [Lolium perenne]|uniref:uncharacterized protein n=1 Tax=Lolium perenne TaxID=4522 RepID=UPI003A99FBAB
MATAIQDAAKTNAATTRQLARLDERLDAQAQALERFHDRPPSLEEDDPDPDVTAIAGTGTLKTARVAWQGETAGASASQGALGRGTTRESARGSGTNNTATGGAGFLGGGGIGGAGGGGVGGASGGGFIRGLKSEIRGLVESQVPQTVERAILLALVQEEVLADAKCWTGKTYQHNRQEAAPARTEQGKPSVKCAKKAELHALTVEKEAEIIVDEVLNVMIILVDSGSSGSFLNTGLAEKLKCQIQKTEAVSVKLPNEQSLHCDSLVPDFTWWTQGETFHTPMRMLNIGAYDAILGVDWLKRHGPIKGDWITKKIKITNAGKRFWLQGITLEEQTTLCELPIEQLAKWTKGNDVWALAVLRPEMEHITEPIPNAVQEVLDEFATVFAEPTTLPPARPYDHTIPLKPDATPFNVCPYRYSPEHKDEIERQIRNMIASGLIAPSMSPFASPVLLVQKKDGTWRFCVDYRRLNELTIRNVFPMPVIDELLDELAGAYVFSKLDLCAGYHQIRMHPADEAKTAFKTNQGHYQFKVMPFGLCNAPATFKCVMNEVLSPCLRRSVLVFMDDILVYSQSMEEHVFHLKEVLQLLQGQQLFVKRSKCTFAADKLEYLGHIISAEGVATDPSKTQAMADWPIPLSITEIRGFLGLTGYYRKFVSHYGIIAKPLTNLLKKKSFEWSEQATEAFQALKEAMLSTPMLSLPNFQKQFVVETDAYNPKSWTSHLPLVEFWYKSSVHSSLGCSPFKALYGLEPNMGALPDMSQAEESPVTDILTERAAQLTVLKENLARAQNHMKRNADKKRVEKEFSVEDKVLLKLQPYAQASVVNMSYPKLAYKFFGPFKVLERIGKAAYMLELPANSKVHDVFHVSQLKEFHPYYTQVFATLPKLPSLDSVDTEPEAILDRRLVKKGNVAVPQVLIKWLGIPADSPTWEDWEVLKMRFPNVLAWGQASTSPGGIVTTDGIDDVP